MDTEDIIFVHGWGEDSRIWKDMAEHLSGYNHHFIDLGFIGNKNDSPPVLDNPALIISHSLGTLWVLKHIPQAKIYALASVNGFGQFTDFTSQKTLETMDKSLHRNTVLQMQLFWKNCNFPQNMRYTYKHKLNERELSQGLSWLGSWDKRQELQDLKTKGVPVLSLGGHDDLILPPEIMQEHWENIGYDVVMKEGAGHSLPITHPKWCAEEIKKTIG